MIHAMKSWMLVGALLCATTVRSDAAKRIVVPRDAGTIQAAIEECDENDTVFVTNGIYRENITLADGIVLIGQDIDRTIIRGDRRGPVVKVSRNAVITGFTIERGQTGILSENTNAIIERNFIRNNSSTGIKCIIALPLIRNNIIADNHWSGIFCELVSRTSNTAIENNVIAENGYCGIMLSNRSMVLVQNNVVMRNKEYGIFVAENAKRSRIINNSIFENRMPFNMYAVIDETNISKDPLLPTLASSRYTDISGLDSPLRGMGKDGTQIGLITESALARAQRDSDKDAIPDRQDQCAEAAEDNDGFEDDDGCPDFDNDFDGIYDQYDECPDRREDFDGFQDLNGCPDDDNDSDGIPDAVDKCPGKPETINQYQDDDGCPDQAQK